MLSLMLYSNHTFKAGEKLGFYFKIHSLTVSIQRISFAISSLTI